MWTTSGLRGITDDGGRTNCVVGTAARWKRTGLSAGVHREQFRLVRRTVCGPFRKQFAKQAGSRHAVACSSGTAALHVARTSHRCGKGKAGC
ncbi:DegT/DnrJ/EryC1/StrS family aminotransferase [Amycolatopsis pithecellobii]|uniref:Uncharacterized protein n=1 Tax=Amycolatopsis pithecellobii TaxID=664692 RepID=A0A6N7ZBA7_9PSEU|nr:hypothetical protein [Amycolatopsis pithecellobii]